MSAKTAWTITTAMEQYGSTIRYAFDADNRVASVTIYMDGWVPNAYKWPTYGSALRAVRQENGEIRHWLERYDRRRSYGRGPSLVAFSARNGRLFSSN